MFSTRTTPENLDDGQKQESPWLGVQPGPEHPKARTYTAALALGGLALSYTLLSVFYFYEDFFKYLGNGAPTTADQSGWMVLVGVPAYADDYYLWTILSPWRLIGALLSITMLGMSAAALWRGRPRARALSLITLWGVLFPQVLWYTEFFVDWHQGRGLPEAVMLALTACALPTALLARRGRPLADWNCASPGRLLGFAIACGWIGFAATEFLDHSYQLDSSLAYLGAVTAVLLAGFAVRGIYKLRAWGLVAGVAAALALAAVPLAATFTPYLANGYIIGNGYIDSLAIATAGTDLRAAFSMALPVLVLWAVAAPFLHGFVQKLRQR